MRRRPFGASVGSLVVVLALVSSGCGRSAVGWTEEGDRLLRSNDLEGAERAYNRAIDEDPHYAPAVYGKAWALYASGLDELKGTAHQLFSRAIDYDPSFYGGYRGRGVLLLEEGNLPAAEVFLRQAWERAPEEAPVIESMGQLYLRAGHLGPARKAFEEAVRQAPERGELRRFLADVAIAERDFDLALRELEKGRSAPLSGKRGLLLLEEGEFFVHATAAQLLFRAAKSTSSVEKTPAEAALAEAEGVLLRMERGGFVGEAALLRRNHLNPLRKRVAAGSDSPKAPAVNPAVVAPDTP